MSTSNLQSQIMNLPCDMPDCKLPIASAYVTGYRDGHLDARRATVELAAKADATIDEIVGLLTFIRANFPLRGMINSGRSVVSIPLAIDRAIARATVKETEMTTDEHKAEVQKYHPNADAWRRKGGRFWFVWPDIDHDTANDILGSGETEAEAWAQAAANAARMS